MIKKTNLIVVGAMKAGTTSFTEMLSEHPDIFFCPIKEPHHFIQDTPKHVFSPPKFDGDVYFSSAPLESLHLRIVSDVKDYQELFREQSTEKYIAEGSTGYIHALESAKLIHDFNPNTKIIVLTREPIKRAYSHYKMDIALGRVSEDFETILKRQINSFHENGRNLWDYLGMSMYNDGINRYKKLFGDQVLVISFEELIKNSEKVKADLYQFLDIKDLGLVLPKSNSSKEIKYKKLVRFLFKSGLKNLGSKILPKRVRATLFNKLQDTEKGMDLSKETINDFNLIISNQNQIL